MDFREKFTDEQRALLWKVLILSFWATLLIRCAHDVIVG